MTCQLTGVISVSLICIHEVAKLPQEGAEESKVIKHLKLGYLCKNPVLNFHEGTGRAGLHARLAITTCS